MTDAAHATVAQLHRCCGPQPVDTLALWMHGVPSARQTGARHAPLRFVPGRLFSAGVHAVYKSLPPPVGLSHGTRGSFTDFRALERPPALAAWRKSACMHSCALRPLRKIIAHSYFHLPASYSPARTSDMHFRSKAQAAPQDHRPHRRTASERVPSTAWLAAQAAFSAPEPAEAEAALVNVRAFVVPAVAALATPRLATDTPLRPERPARVFLVPSDTPSATEGNADDGSKPPPAAGAQQTAETTAEIPPATAPGGPDTQAQPAAHKPTPRPRRRVHADKLPGPVLHITRPQQTQAQAPARAPARAAAQDPLPAALGSMSAGEQIHTLQALMAPVHAVFDDILKARALHFVD